MAGCPAAGLKNMGCLGRIFSGVLTDSYEQTTAELSLESQDMVVLLAMLERSDSSVVVQVMSDTGLMLDNDCSVVLPDESCDVGLSVVSSLDKTHLKSKQNSGVWALGTLLADSSTAIAACVRSMHAINLVSVRLVKPGCERDCVDKKFIISRINSLRSCVLFIICA